MALPDWLEPMAATLTQDRFATPDWIFERKFDGIRVIAYKPAPDVRLYSRTRLPQHLPGGGRSRSPPCRSPTRFSTARSPGIRRRPITSLT
jgi:hypothetical protein